MIHQDDRLQCVEMLPLHQDEKERKNLQVITIASAIPTNQEIAAIVVIPLVFVQIVLADAVVRSCKVLIHAVSRMVVM